MGSETALAGQFATLALKGALKAGVDLLRDSKSKQSTEKLCHDLAIERNTVNGLIREAERILDEPNGRHFRDLRDLAYKQIIAQSWVDAINFQLKNGSSAEITWEKLKSARVELECSLKIREAGRRAGTSEFGSAQHGARTVQISSTVTNYQIRSERCPPQSQTHIRRSSTLPLIRESASGTSQQTPTGREIAGHMPPSHVRRCLLYLHYFYGDHVLNLKRVTRLCTAHKLSQGDSKQPPSLQQLTDCIEVVERSLDRDVAKPSHFQIGNAMRKRRGTWPETQCFSSLDASASTNTGRLIRDEIALTSFCFLGNPRNITVNIGKELFLVKILTIRNVNLADDKEYSNIQKLSLLRYLDLKHSNVKACEWLKGLEELQLLDLRYTMVESIPDKCVKNLVNIQHLLLGYIPNNQAKRLAGATLDIEKLMTGNLKTLRAVFAWPKNEEDDTRRVRDVDVSTLSNLDDLSVTGLKKKTLEHFWKVLEGFKKLTSLGVALTEGSVILEGCPQKLKEKLKRLKIEGRFSSHRIDGLSVFSSLVDLTLASPASGTSRVVRVDMNSIPPLKKLLCLRLYGVNDEQVLAIPEQFKTLKKLVIGDMKVVQTIEISSAVIRAIDTLKLCDLPNFSKLVSLISKELILRRKGEEESAHNKFKNVEQINIFLRGDYNHLPISSKGKGKAKASSSSRYANFDKSRGVKIYRYDMNKQCYVQFEN